MAIEDIGKNALQVLEKRYLAKDAEGNHTEDVAGLFRRVAAAVAAADRNYDENADTAALADSFYEHDDQPGVSAELPHADERGPAVGAAFGLLCAAGGGQHGGDFRDGEKRRPHPQVRRRHGLFVFPSAAERRAPSIPPAAWPPAPSALCGCSTWRPRRSSRAAPGAGPIWASCGWTIRISWSSSTARRNNADITNFNISVGITEAFMKAVEEDAGLRPDRPAHPARGGQTATPGRCLTRSWTRPGATASRASSSWTG